MKNNGGPTPTIALLPGSPAIDGADPYNILPTDRRGFDRNVDGNGDGAAKVDIGAFEYASTALPSNLLLNASFEQGFAPWINCGSSDTVLNPDAPNGSFELQIGTNAGGSAQTVSALPNTTYLLSGWGRVSLASEIGWIGVHYLDSAGNQVAPQTVIEFNNTTYEQKQITLQTPSNTAELRIWAWKNEGAGYFYVDNINLVTNSTPVYTITDF